jgi:hypothetical protein
MNIDPNMFIPHCLIGTVEILQSRSAAKLKELKNYP